MKTCKTALHLFNDKFHCTATNYICKSFKVVFLRLSFLQCTCIYVYDSVFLFVFISAFFQYFWKLFPLLLEALIPSTLCIYPWELAVDQVIVMSLYLLDSCHTLYFLLVVNCISHVLLVPTCTHLFFVNLQ